MTSPKATPSQPAEGGHTPGPWFQNPANAEEIMVAGDASVVARVPSAKTGLYNKRGPANARLIVAAPDLVAALIAAKQALWIEARSGWTLADFKNWAVVQQIDAALDKADGKTRAALSKADPTS